MDMTAYATRVTEYNDEKRSHFYSDLTGFQINKVCYGQINELHSEEGEGAENLYVFHKDVGEDCREWHDFILQDDMFGPVFLTKDFDEGVKSGWEMNLDMPYSQVLGGMIALRAQFFYIAQTGPNNMYSSLRRDGATVREAAVLADLTYAHGDKGEFLGICGYPQDHAIFDRSSTLQAFLEGVGPGFCDGEGANSSGYIDGSVWDVWGYGGHNNNQTTMNMRATFQRTEKRDPFGGEIVMPINNKYNRGLLLSALRTGDFK